MCCLFTFRLGLRMISSSFLPENTHMTFQTPWMAEQFLAREEDGSVYSGGLLSDVTYKFFANGYLMTTSMYHTVIHRWIPMQLTWLHGLSEEHYVAHFTALMNQIKHAQLLPAERDILVRQVVDFSAVQKNGFMRAYMEVFDVTDRAQALGKLRGCQEHFRAQVTRIRRNLNIIPRHQQVSFCLISKKVLIINHVIHRWNFRGSRMLSWKRTRLERRRMRKILQP